MDIFLCALGLALVIAFVYLFRPWNRIRLEGVSPIRYAAEKVITNQPIVTPDRKITAHTVDGTVSIHYIKDDTISSFDKLRIVAESDHKRYVKVYYRIPQKTTRAVAQQ